MFNFIHKIRDNYILNFVCILVIILITNGTPVPNNNEYLYLLLPIKQWDHDFLLNDWTFSKPDSAHLIFNILIGPLILLTSPEIMGWVGRIVSWSLIIIALLHLGRHFQIPLWMITISIILWVLQSQPAGGEWIFQGFEAKCISYILLLFSINGYINNREILSSILLGLSFTFHPAIGLLGGIATILSLIILKYTVKKLVKILLFTVVFALPGLIPLLPFMFGNNNISSEDWKFISLVVMPFHLDPFSWPKRDILLLYVLFLFNLLHFRKNKEDQALRFFISFQFFLCVFFTLGFLFRYFEKYEFLQLYPFRLFPLFIPLFFFFHLMNAYYHRSSVELSKGAVVIGFLALLSLANPLAEFVDRAKDNYTKWMKKEDDIQISFKWISQNTPNGSIVISPPWRKDIWYLSKRAQIGCWPCPNYDGLGEWRERMGTLLCDDLRKLRKKRGELLSDILEPYYNKLTEKDVESIVGKYRANYLVSKKAYSYQILFDSGTYKVYYLNHF